MTLIFPAPPVTPDLAGPRLHAFVIGVADYPHLGGGTGPRAPDPFGLSQVSTPQHTAAAIASWLCTEYRNPDVPLGSVELLLSPSAAGGTPAAPAADRATMRNVRDAFAAWLRRCNGDERNIAFFYFCGHGIARTDQFLLPEDFADPSVPNTWTNCINFDGMRTGMRACRAQTQLFFVDACRETPFAMLNQLHAQGDPLISATTDDVVSSSSVYRATTEGNQAFGPPDDVTYFGQALLSCLRGVGAMQYSGRWVVNTASLGHALAHSMDVIGRRARRRLTCHPSPQGIVTLSEAARARVLLVVECTSPDASRASEIVLQNATAQVRSAVGDPKPLLEEVDGGDWDIAVTFPNNEFPDALIREKLVPPVYFGVPVP